MVNMMFRLFALIFLSLGFLTQAVAEEVYPADIRYLHVQSGQTLHNIVRRLYPERVKDWSKLRAEIVRTNPDAFIDGDETRMKAGSILQLPKRMVVRALPLKPAMRKLVGKVENVRGQVLAVDTKKVSRTLGKNDSIYIGDKLITGDDGFVRLLMVDNAILNLNCYSIMVIEDYQIKTGSRRSILNLLQGSLRKVTGTIGKLTGDVYELKTPLANIGVRGTEYALRVFQSKGCSGTIDTDDRLYIRVIKGLVDVHNKGGSVVFAKGESGSVLLPDKAPVKQKVDEGVFTPVTEKPETEVKTEEEGSNFWWWLLGIVGLAALI